MKEVVQVMEGSHRCWHRALSTGFVNGSSSTLTAGHISDLLSWKVIQEVPRTDLIRCSRFFLVPKSCLTRSRPILDARGVNSLVDRDHLPGSASFRLLPPVFVARLVFAPRGDPKTVRLAVLDARSWFTSLRWGLPLQRLHGFRVGSRYFRHLAPSQGSTLLPWVAQVTTLSIALGPPVNAPFAAFIAAGIAVTYDDILIADVETRAKARYEQIQRRMVEVGGEFSKLVPPGRTVEYCGVQYDLDRGWRLKPDWVEAFLQERWPRIRDGSIPQSDLVLAGCAVWVCTALVVPLVHVVDLLHAEPSLSQVEWLLALVRRNPWRSMHSFASSPPLDCDVVVFDGSIYGAGWIDGTGEHARPWLDAPRSPRQQQVCEWEALTLALEAAGSSSTPLLVIGDNLGVLQALSRGISTLPAGIRCITSAAARTRHLFTAWVPSERNEADRASRMSQPLDAPYRLQLDVGSLSSAAVEVTWTAVSPLDQPLPLDASRSSSCV